MSKTWKSLVAGILDIVAGSLSCIASLSLIAGILVFSIVSRSSSIHIPYDAPRNIALLIVILAVPYLALAVLSIVGGIFTLKRKKWGLAIAGSIAAAIISWLFGIPALVFTIIARDEFASNEPQSQ